MILVNLKDPWKLATFIKKVANSNGTNLKMMVVYQLLAMLLKNKMLLLAVGFLLDLSMLTKPILNLRDSNQIRNITLELRL
ncbi:hypothetical protein NQ314_016330 [Rhamnusium bicolor]|uniref:Uncharacterized protein n=1 Tax=Rhamnusium bicolor TaxID=1586634 RepID=A0AAV8WW33_9CUCU|nr:hypothetical protein NQ314_016330 [Rhamnusium bicolor]